MSYNVKSLGIVECSGILSSDDFSVINNLRNELEDVFLHSQIFRTRTEMDVSVLSDIKFPTPDAKYWQAVREQNVMFKELVMLSYEYRKNIVEIKILERNLSKENDLLEQELLQIEIEKKQFISLDMERTAKDRIREIREWHEIKERLIPDMNYSLEDVNEHQLISYTKRWINQFEISINSGCQLSSSEMSNLYSQLDKGLKLCVEKNVLDKVLEDMNPSTIQLLKNTNPNELKLIGESVINMTV